MVGRCSGTVSHPKCASEESNIHEPRSSQGPQPWRERARAGLATIAVSIRLLALAPTGRRGYLGQPGKP